MKISADAGFCMKALGLNTAGYKNAEVMEMRVSQILIFVLDSGCTSGCKWTDLDQYFSAKLTRRLVSVPSAR